MFNCSNIGENNVTLTVTDGAGRTATCVAEVTVRDVTAPTFTCPAPVTVASCLDVVPNLLSGLTATDNCTASTAIVITQNPAAGVAFGNVQNGQTTIVITATDAAGNTSTCSVAVRILDATAPVIACPASITVGNDVDKCGANVTYSIPTATDDCPNVTLSRTGLASGAFFPVGSTTVVYTATDVAGNTATCSFTVTVMDMQAPNAVCKDAVVDLDATGNATITAASIDGGSNDNCPATLTLVAGTTTFNCSNIGENNVTLTVTDGAGRTATCVAEVTVRDVTAPTFTCPAPVSVSSCLNFVPNFVTTLTATDNCTASTAISITQSVAAGTRFGAANGDFIDVVITATDASGNERSCTVRVTIADTGKPVFVDCPTTPLVFGNDPDQCSAKVNWAIPVALDDCAPLSTVTQIEGPLPGSILPITCPATSTTITYRATDGAGNTTLCSFTVMAMDTEKPEFDADILMPGDVTVECDAVPSNCIPRTGGTCTPLTNADVNDNCTAPANLVVAYNQTSTQGANPANCDFYNYTLTRTWSVTDCAGNILRHTQVITVRDTKAPNAVCKPATVTLDKNGNASITAADVNNGSSDNCAAQQFLTLSVSPSAFTCANLGANTVVLTVTDPCGNSATCTATVTVNEGIAPCTPQYSVTTRCLDNATVKNDGTSTDDGQFEDVVTIKSLAMQTWAVTSSTGAHSTASANPPVVPIALAAGTLFMAGTDDNIDNDGDGQFDEADEMIWYTLKLRHTDCAGYTLNVSNSGGRGAAPAATNSVLQNKACYPTPLFSNLTGPYCLGTSPFTIVIGEQNNAVPTSIRIFVNGVETNIFNANALGLGTHTVEARFDAGTATSWFRANGVTISGSDAATLTDPGCLQIIRKTVQIVPTPTAVKCNDLIQVSLDANCSAVLFPDDVLEGGYPCFDDYRVVLTYPAGTTVFTSPNDNRVNGSHAGRRIKYTLVHPISGNTCWGEILVEDKLPPALTCPPNITIACSQPTTTAVTGNVVATDCSTFGVVTDDVYTDLGQCNTPRGTIVRTFIATDKWNNQASCSHVITINPFRFQDLQWPANVTVNCAAAYLNPNALQPVNTGRPSLNGAPIGTGGLCMASISMEDERFDICPGSYEILRTWKVRNMCTPISNDPANLNPRTYTQVIKVQDNQGPIMELPANVTVSTDAKACCAKAPLPDVIIIEGCSNITKLEAKVTGVDPNTGNITTFTVLGRLGDFSGNNYWTPDTLAIFPTTQCLVIGDYNVQYTAEDQCGNVTRLNFVLSVRDLTPPIMACDQNTVISIDGDDPDDCYLPSSDGCEFAGVAWLKAKTIDDGSYDNCKAGLTFKVRRMDPYSAFVEGLNKDDGIPPCNDKTGRPTEYERATATGTMDDGFGGGADSLKFYCGEVGDSVRVILRAYQRNENGVTVDSVFNECMVWVHVQDKVRPNCVAPAQVSVSCENFDPSLWAYGQARVEDNCCLDCSYTYQGVKGLSHTASYTAFDTACNRGTIVRNFTAYDCHGFTTRCTQNVIVSYKEDYYVRFPDDRIITVCDGTGNYGTPTFFGEDCELLATSFRDDTFTVVQDACYKIERTWKIINWCTYDPNCPLTYVPNPNPNVQANASANLPGPIVSNIDGCLQANALNPWRSACVRINPTDAAPTSYTQFWQLAQNCPQKGRAHFNGYEYKQIIKIIDTEAPVPNCVKPDTCDLTENDIAFWNRDYWWDAKHESHDLCEMPIDLKLTATDACSGPLMSIRYLLFLDLDNNGSMETVVNSVNTPPTNTVYYGNATNPNYTGGVARAFDDRIVNNPALDHYRFAIQYTTSGANLTAAVRFNTVRNPNTYVLPQLPHGKHKIKWIVSDGCGNERVCEYTFEIKDCKKPTIVCKPLSVNIMQTGMVTIWASDFLEYGFDNCTPAEQLKYSISTGDPAPSSFPLDANGNPITSVTFDCTHRGANVIQLWAQDRAGNADFCQVILLVQDNMGNCGPKATIAGELKTEAVQGVQDANVELNGSHPAAPPISLYDMSNQQGSYSFSNAVPILGNYTVTPVRDDNPLNGVTTLDLAMISKHILNLNPLNSPYKLIAADANKSGTITTLDIVALRRLILGIDQELGNNTSWRFVDRSYTFPNPQNPFTQPFPETKTFAQLQASQVNEHFVGMKIGDVNGTAQANSLMSAGDRTSSTLLFDIDDRTVRAGEVVEVKFRAAERVTGYQFTLNHTGLEVMDILPGTGMGLDNFAVFAGDNAVTTSFNGDVTGEFTIKFRAKQAGELNKMLGVSSRITKAIAYSANEEGAQVAFRFNKGSVSTISGLGFELYQNMPNPFVDKTMIGFYLPDAAKATLTVYDESGRVVFTQKGEFAKGYNQFTLERELVPTVGLLYYKVETATDSATKKMTQTK
jgi:hypothetical protein